MKSVKSPFNRVVVVTSVVGAVVIAGLLLIQFGVAGALVNSTQAVTSLPTEPAGPTQTTLPPPGPPIPAGDTGSGPIGTLPQRVPTSPPRISTIPANACVDSNLEASVTGYGIQSMNFDQDIVTVTSLTPCSISGFLNVSFSNSQPLSATIDDGGTDGSFSSPGAVALGPNESGSFVLQYQDFSYCPVATDMFIGTVDSTPDVPVSLSPVNGDQTGWTVCSPIQVSAIEQGNDPAQYLP